MNHNQLLSDKQFLVTGGAGFIGSHLAEHLVVHGAKKVRVVDNLSTGSMDNIAHLMSHQNFEFILNDLTNEQVCLDACSGMDIVFHQAALGSVPRSIEYPLQTNANNVNAQLNILWACVQQKVCRLIYASSSSVYGDDNHFPKTENYIGVPLSPYAVSKKVNELYAQVFSSLYKLPVIGLRYFNVFGPRQNPEGPYAAVIPLFIDALMNNKDVIIYGDGEQSRDFTYVENIVQANIKAAFTTNEQAFGQVMNIGAGGNTSVNDLFKIIAKLLQSQSQPVYASQRKGDVQKSSASIDKASQMIEYAPTVLIKEGIEKTITYFTNGRNEIFKTL